MSSECTTLKTDLCSGFREAGSEMSPGSWPSGVYWLGRSDPGREVVETMSSWQSRCQHFSHANKVEGLQNSHATVISGEAGFAETP